MNSPPLSLTIENGKAIVRVPYNPTFNQKIKRIGGRWEAPHWSVDARDVDRVRKAMVDVYGTDGTEGERLQTVSVRYTVSYDDSTSQEISACGRVICRRFSRDNDVYLSPGVVLLGHPDKEGGFDEKGFPSSGGSVKNPRINGGEGLVLEIRDVPLPLAERLTSEYPARYQIAPETVSAPLETPPPVPETEPLVWELTYDEKGLMNAFTNAPRGSDRERSTVSEILKLPMPRLVPFLRALEERT